MKILNRIKKNKNLWEFIKKIAFRYTPFGIPNFSYNLETTQLATIVNELERLKDTKGNILEIGVARGMTTRFICEYLSETKDIKTTIYALDTFNSFKEKDVNFEVSVRKKKIYDVKGFSYIDYNVWKKNFKIYPMVKIIKADCSNFDYHSLGEIKFAILDVDLYLPTKNALSLLFSVICKGGSILVDDVKSNEVYDGAFQAFNEFIDKHKLSYIKVGNKGALIIKE